MFSLAPHRHALQEPARCIPPHSATTEGPHLPCAQVAEKVNALSRGHHDNHIGIEAGAVITDSGQLRCGEPCGLPAA
jgi:hypothetical protein